MNAYRAGNFRFALNERSGKGCGLRDSTQRVQAATNTSTNADAPHNSGIGKPSRMSRSGGPAQQRVVKRARSVLV